MLDLAMLAALHEKYREAAALPVADFALGAHRIDFARRTYLMGVINLSPDSWYRESVALNTEAAIRRGRASSTGWRSVRRRPGRRRLSVSSRRTSGATRRGR